MSSSITPTMGQGSNAFVTGKLANMPGRRNVPVHYIGQTTILWSDNFYRTVDVWKTNGIDASAYLRYERADGKGRARYYYDPSGQQTSAIIRSNSV